MLGLIEHVVEPIKLLKRSHQLLKRDGLLIIQTPNTDALFAKMLGKYWPPFAPIEHIHLFSRTSLEKALENIGFKTNYFVPHWKLLPVNYVYNQFDNFGPEFKSLFKPVRWLLRDVTLPFYIGEMIVVAQKS